MIELAPPGTGTVAVTLLVAGSMRTAVLASNDVAQTASAVATSPYVCPPPMSMRVGPPPAPVGVAEPPGFAELAAGPGGPVVRPPPVRPPPEQPASAGTRTDTRPMKRRRR